jgi:hypothetical protein
MRRHCCARAIAAVMFVACTPRQEPDPRLLDLTTAAERAFAAANEQDSSALRGLLTDAAVYESIWGIKSHHPGLVKAAADGLDLIADGSFVERDTAYVIVDVGRIRQPDRMEILFLRSAQGWRIHHVGLPEVRGL